jgi:superfamily II DNA or RNA helicase
VTLLLDTQPADTPRPTLRFYQRDCIDRTVEALDVEDAVHTDGLDVLPTGAGKTNTLLEYVHEQSLARGGRTLLLAHRRELIHQPIQRMIGGRDEVGLHPEYRGEVGMVMAEHNDVRARLVVATVQTLSSSSARLDELLRWGPFDHLITDEAHHSVSKTYVAIRDYLRARSPGMRHVGFTATPIRADGDGLRKVFSVVPYKVTIKDMIGWGFLVPIDAYKVETEIDISGVQISRSTGELNQTQLTRVFDVDNWSELVVRTHLDRVPDKRFIAFTVGVKHAHHLADRFRRAGKAVVSVDGSTPKEVRDQVLRRFRAGDLDGICNCAVFTEGLDLPGLEVAHMVAPCASDLLYMQKLGRVLRPFPGKDRAIVFDYVPLGDRNIVMAGDVLGKPRKQRAQEAKAAKAGLIIEEISDMGTGTGLDGDPDKLYTTPLDYLSASPFQWFVHRGTATLDLGPDDDQVTGRVMVISKPAASDGQHRLAVLTWTRGYRDPEMETLGAAPPAGYAALVAQGQAYAEEHAVGNLARRDRAWHTRPASAKQRHMILGLERHLDAGDLDPERLTRLSAREASQLITHARARQGLAAIAVQRARALTGVA